MARENPHKHLKNFLDMCFTSEQPLVSKDAVLSHFLCKGLDASNQSTVNSLASGSITDLTFREANALLEKMVNTNSEWVSSVYLLQLNSSIVDLTMQIQSQSQVMAELTTTMNFL
ncbi:hypothetical protein HAX54_010452, partial [Datura stramonium]|nr:hypothetical protein [Datura stramonium]